MPTILITGANRGIGLEFARQYSKGGWNVVATTRSPYSELDALGASIVPLDLSDPESVLALTKMIEQPLDLLIANAGTSHPMNAANAQDARDWATMMMVNCIAPYMLGKMLLPRLADACGKLIAISSGMGSIDRNNGGWLPYRTSKSALNMAWSTLAIEARGDGVPAVMLSPGWVKTRMGGAGAKITPQESVCAMRTLIDGFTIEDSGRFLGHDGSEIPW
jgi:NAD(P)-dependent dehydrogenase (short-subunit alcohol dehydrogenase family)